MNHKKGCHTAIFVCVITLQTLSGGWCRLPHSPVYTRTNACLLVCGMLAVGLWYMCIIAGATFTLYDTDLLSLVFWAHGERNLVLFVLCHHFPVPILQHANIILLCGCGGDLMRLCCPRNTYICVMPGLKNYNWFAIKTSILLKYPDN